MWLGMPTKCYPERAERATPVLGDLRSKYYVLYLIGRLTSMLFPITYLTSRTTMLKYHWGKTLLRTAREIPRARARMSTESGKTIKFGPFEVTSQVSSRHKKKKKRPTLIAR